ncbi:MAG TPA: endo-1,4-beta-xylanase [Candidatus Limnocylindrales bacterium]|nr:endo-1,4-beta-xylanase [Candidatus Limnocylindrales bacterium]
MSGPKRGTRPRRTAAWLAATVLAATAATIVITATPSQAAGPLRAVSGSKFIGYAANAALLCNNTATCTSGQNTTYRNLAQTEFNQITPENAMKWDTIEPSAGNTQFAQADGIVANATANNQIVHGHTLLWHSQAPNYIMQASGTTMRDLLRSHINNVMGHYANNPTVKGWDVVNEVINDNSSPQLRQSFWTSNYPGNFVRDAFTFARAADPDAELCINDYSVEGDPTQAGTKANRLFQLVQTEKAAGTPIDCVGLQSHFIVGQIPNLATSFARWATLGVRVRISELDIRIPLPADATELQTQANNYASVVNACKGTATCEGITIWGIDDGHSWLPNSCCPEGAPLLWDANFAKKPAYDATANAFGTIVDPTPPSTPTNLTAPTVTSNSVSLTWSPSTDNVGVTGYDVLRAPGASGGTFTVVGSPTSTSFTDTNLPANTTFRYQVRAKDAAGNMSGVSTPITVTTQMSGPDPTPPTPPANLASPSVTPSSVSLTWSPSTDNVGVTGYDVLRAPGASGGTFAVVGSPTATSFTDSGLPCNTIFRYQVRAKDAAGNLSQPSNTIVVTTGPCTTGGCAATLVLQTQWPTGYVFQPVRVTNNGTSSITGWTVVVTLPAGHALTGFWNATVTVSGQTLTFHGVGFNSNLAPGATGEFGFQASRPNGNTALPTNPTCTAP